MQILNFDASSVDGFKGQVKLEALPYTELLLKFEEFNFKQQKDGSMESAKDQLRSMREMIIFAMSRAKEVEVTHLKSGVTLKSCTEMDYNLDFKDILNAMAVFFINGGKVGNS